MPLTQKQRMLAGELYRAENPELAAQSAKAIALKTGGRWITVAAFTYVILYAFALILVAVCYTMLTTKRLRDRRRHIGLAGMIPLLILFAASLHFMRGQTPDVIVLPYVVTLDALLAMMVVWTVAELGFGGSR